MMYQCLVNYTGAKPAEYYTVQKRPDYANYQKMVNMFVPGPRKELKEWLDNQMYFTFNTFVKRSIKVVITEFFILQCNVPSLKYVCVH